MKHWLRWYTLDIPRREGRAIVGRIVIRTWHPGFWLFALRALWRGMR